MSHFKATSTTPVHNHKTDISDLINTTFANLVRSVKLPYGTTYRYVFSPPSNSEKPYLLFLHGFSETSYGWHHQIAYFTEQGYGVMVPDLLGYGGTDNPSNLEAFKFKHMAADLGELLDSAGVDTVIGIARDMGVPLLSGLVNYHPARLAAVAFLNNGYFPPQAKLDAPTIDAINDTTLASFGYQALGYWLFFNEDHADKILNQHQDSFYTLAYTRDTLCCREGFGPPGALQRWLQQDRVASDLYVSKVDLEQWKCITNTQGGFNGPMKWYRALMRGINNPDKTDLDMDGTFSLPCLLVVADRDPFAIAASQISQTLPYTSNIRVRTVNTGHFMQIEAPQEVNKHLDLFIRDVMNTPASGSASIAVHYEGGKRVTAHSKSPRRQD